MIFKHTAVQRTPAVMAYHADSEVNSSQHPTLHQSEYSKRAESTTVAIAFDDYDTLRYAKYYPTEMLS